MSDPRGYVGVGSNLDPEDHVVSALQLLHGQLPVTGVSTFYRTAPLERPDQPPFANGVFRVQTSLAPRQLKQLLCAVEVKLGRRRTGDRHAPRTIDLDLLVLGDLVLDDVRFRLPDPDIRRRPFVALPLQELAPGLILPDTGEPLSEVCAGLAPDGLVADPELTRKLRAVLSGLEAGS